MASLEDTGLFMQLQDLLVRYLTSLSLSPSRESTEESHNPRHLEPMWLLLLTDPMLFMEPVMVL